MADVNGQLDRLQHVTTTKGVPRVHNRIVPEADIDAHFQEFLDARNATALGIGVKTALKEGIVKGVGDYVDLRLTK